RSAPTGSQSGEVRVRTRGLATVEPRTEPCGGSIRTTQAALVLLATRHPHRKIRGGGTITRPGARVLSERARGERKFVETSFGDGCSPRDIHRGLRRQRGLPPGAPRFDSNAFEICFRKISE